ncbi:MAG: tetratricopeptide repeat protein [Treponema sp.]|nr:tetratricopeptide repeat protein [Treponema sp.]
MKTKFLLPVIFLLSFFVFSQEATSSEIALYREINTYISNGYYPGVIEKVEKMEKEFPESVFIVPSLLSKSEALISMGQCEDAELTLEKVLPSLHFGNENLDKCWFLFGESQYLLKDYDKALRSFYNCCAISLKAEKKRYYNPSVLYSGRIYYINSDFEKAIPLFEYVVSNGKSYSSDNYIEAIQKLFVSYNSSKNYKKTIELYEMLKPSDFSEEVFSFINFYAAEAYSENGNYLEGYNLYCSLIENKNQNLAVASLKKAYVISHDRQLNVDTNEISKRITENEESFSPIISDFWSRLGIDAYNSKDYKKARECFNFAQRSKTSDTEIIIQIYEIAMELDEGMSVSNAKRSSEILKQMEPKVLESKIDKLADTYYSVLITCSAIIDDWNTVQSSYEKIVYHTDDTLYYGAASYYKQGNYAEAEGIIKNCKTSKGKALYANILGRLGRNEEASKIYVALNASQELSSKDRLEFAKVLYNQKKFDAAYKHAKTANQPLSSYICGLCSVRLGNWSDAMTLLDSYLNKYANKYGYTDEAYFYRSLAEYKNGDYVKAYKDFEYFGTLSSPNISFTRRAYSYAAKSAVMQGDFTKAAVQAEKLRKLSFTQKDKEEAVIFCAEIYTDSGDYAKAISTLEPYTLGQSDFALKVSFLISEIYEKTGNYQKTDELYEKIFKDFPKSKEAEEALYRRGELYLNRKDYVTAENRFSEYINNYGRGAFADAAYYYSADCNLQLKQYNKSVMLNKTLLARFPSSSFTYGALKNLLIAYYEEEKYGEALNIANQIVKQFPAQAVSDGINKREVELEKIVGGTDRHIVEKVTEYEKNGGSSTEKGRSAGSELVQLYAVYGSRTDAFNLAMELIPLQKGKGENFDRGENCYFVASYYKENNDAKSAAQMYLKAAEYYRSSGIDKNSKAAAALYAAVDCFVSESMGGDARQTADLLIKLYPSTRQAQSVKGLLN